MVIFSLEFRISWSLRSIGFGADLQRVIRHVFMFGRFRRAWWFHLLARVLLFVSLRRYRGGLHKSIMPGITTAVYPSSPDPRHLAA